MRAGCGGGAAPRSERASEDQARSRGCAHGTARHGTARHGTARHGTADAAGLLTAIHPQRRVARLEGLGTRARGTGGARWPQGGQGRTPALPGLLPQALPALPRTARARRRPKELAHLKRRSRLHPARSTPVPPASWAPTPKSSLTSNGVAACTPPATAPVPRASCPTPKTSLTSNGVAASTPPATAPVKRAPCPAPRSPCRDAATWIARPLLSQDRHHKPSSGTTLTTCGCAEAVVLPRLLHAGGKGGPARRQHRRRRLLLRARLRRLQRRCGVEPVLLRRRRPVAQLLGRVEAGKLVVERLAGGGVAGAPCRATRPSTQAQLKVVRAPRRKL